MGNKGDHNEVGETPGSAAPGGRPSPTRRLAWRFMPRIRRVNTVAILVAAVLAIVAIATIDMVYDADRRAEQSQREYAACLEAAFELENASDYLTSEARLYAVTGNRAHLDNYL